MRNTGQENKMSYDKNLSFEDLLVWKKSCQLAVNIYDALKNCNDYGLKDQMLRASISIPSNIAEGQERSTVPDFKRFLAIAKGSAAELRTQLYIAAKLNIIPKETADNLINDVKEISKMLQGLVSSLD
jgi:four helix bundle protein